jgi:hypothetical protein
LRWPRGSTATTSNSPNAVELLRHVRPTDQQWFIEEVTQALAVAARQGLSTTAGRLEAWTATVGVQRQPGYEAMIERMQRRERGWDPAPNEMKDHPVAVRSGSSSRSWRASRNAAESEAPPRSRRCSVSISDTTAASLTGTTLAMIPTVPSDTRLLAMPSSSSARRVLRFSLSDSSSA